MHIQVFKYTTDYWCPCYTTDEGSSLATVAFVQMEPQSSDFEWQVYVGGSDTYGWKKYFTKETEAWACFLEVIGLYDVTKQALREIGFEEPSNNDHD